MAAKHLDPDIIKAVAVTMELIGAAPMSEAAARIFCGQLMTYPKQAVLGALMRCQRECVRVLPLSYVIERLDDGRPGAEEAFLSYPRDEDVSAVITTETSECMQGDGSDRVAARMAFKERYTKLVQRNRDAGIPVKWFLSPGRNAEGRADVVADAVRLGRFDAEHGLKLVLPEHRLKVLAHVPPDLREPLMLKHKIPRDELTPVGVTLQKVLAAIISKKKPE